MEEVDAEVELAVHADANALLDVLGFDHRGMFLVVLCFCSGCEAVCFRYGYRQCAYGIVLHQPMEVLEFWRKSPVYGVQI